MNKNSVFKPRVVKVLPKIYSFFFLCCLSGVYGQNTNITGIVTDDNGALAGVSILLKSRPVATLTDEKGNYAIIAGSNDILIFSFMGYKTVEIPVKNHSIINVHLREDATNLKEVTINAGYYSVKDKERTGSIARITSKDIEKQPVTNVLATMQGRMAGVNIQQQTGLAGSSFSIQIRGTNSVRSDGNEPLYIIDGVPYASQSLGNTILSAGIRAGNVSPLNTINPADIASIEVLKDADATSIYGSRGANGVVLITTKKGKAGKSRLSIQSYTSMGTVASKLDLMNTPQYLAIRKEAFANDGITVYPENAYDVNGTWSVTKHTDWQKELIGGTAYISNFQAALSGGSTSTQYLLSSTFRKETTVYPGDSNYRNAVMHSSIVHKSADDKFNLTFNADYATDKNTLPGVDLTSEALKLAPNAPDLYDRNRNLNWENGTFQNPLGYLNGEYLSKTQSLIANALVLYKFPKGFEFRTSFGYTDIRLSESKTSPTTMYSPFNNVGNDIAELYINDGKKSSWIVEPQLNWQKKWNDLEINILAGTTLQVQNSESLAINGLGFPNDALINSIAAATNIYIVNQEFTAYRYNALFARINLNLKSQYILNMTGRRDGSSRFGPDNRFANFGAIGAAWLFSKNRLFLDSKVLNFGKLRSSFGTTGNDQIGDYQFLNTYGLAATNYNGVIGIQPMRLFNSSFGWETNKKLEVAIDLGFFNDAIFLTTAWFRNRSSSQLVGETLPGTTGFSSIMTNLDATVQNTGVEVELQTVNLKKKNFKWTTTFNLTIPQNKLLSFPKLQESSYANYLVVGESINVQKVYHYTGINSTTGTYSFQDFDNNGLINATGDRQLTKDTAPKYYGGFGNQLTYKNITLDFLFQFNKQLGRNYLYTTNIAGTFTNLPAEMANHYPQNGENALVQQYTTGTNSAATSAYFNYRNSDATISDASYIKLKSICLTYALPHPLSKTFAGSIYVEGRNLFTITNYRGLDPENQSTNYLPPLRQITLGLQISF
jgi:TonB-linked SusC/RagA family outer membrane protein